MGQLQTRNVDIHFNDTPDGLFRAQAIQKSCENDIAGLAAFFRTTYDISGLNRAGTRVYIISPPGSGASNIGWKGPLAPTSIDINGDYAPASPSSGDPVLRADFASLLFCAEFAEILMDVSPGGWDRGQSDGEALSIILATERHPDAYYSAANLAPRVNAWLQSDRPDWVASTEPSDTNILSYGCGILFINYLRFQWGFDLAKIIAARPAWGTGFLGHVTLADRYAALTGNPASQAFPEFMALLEKHLPLEKAAQCMVGRDNIFPLRDAAERSVYTSSRTLQLSSNRLEPSQHVTLSPGPLCGAGEFPVWRVEEVSEVTVSASCAGFALADFKWSVNGVEVTAGGPQAAVTADVLTPHTDRTVTTATGVGIAFAGSISSTWNRSTLKLRNVGHEGTYKLTISVTAHERLKNDGDAKSAQSVELPTLHFEYSRAFADAQRRCNGDLVQMSADLQKLSAAMLAYKNAPDPQPDLRIGEILAAAVAVNESMRKAADRLGDRGHVFLQELSRNEHLGAELAATRGALSQAVEESRSHPFVLTRGKTIAEH